MNKLAGEKTFGVVREIRRRKSLVLFLLLGMGGECIWFRKPPHVALEVGDRVDVTARLCSPLCKRGLKGTDGVAYARHRRCPLYVFVHGGYLPPLQLGEQQEEPPERRGRGRPLAAYLGEDWSCDGDLCVAATSSHHQHHSLRCDEGRDAVAAAEAAADAVDAVDEGDAQSDNG